MTDTSGLSQSELSKVFQHQKRTTLKTLKQLLKDIYAQIQAEAEKEDYDEDSLSLWSQTIQSIVGNLERVQAITIPKVEQGHKTASKILVQISSLSNVPTPTAKPARTKPAGKVNQPVTHFGRPTAVVVGGRTGSMTSMERNATSTSMFPLFPQGLTSAADTPAYDPNLLQDIKEKRTKIEKEKQAGLQKQQMIAQQEAMHRQQAEAIAAQEALRIEKERDVQLQVLREKEAAQQKEKERQKEERQKDLQKLLGNIQVNLVKQGPSQQEKDKQAQRQAELKEAFMVKKQKKQVSQAAAMAEAFNNNQKQEEGPGGPGILYQGPQGSRLQEARNELESHLQGRGKRNIPLPVPASSHVPEETQPVQEDKMENRSRSREGGRRRFRSRSRSPPRRRRPSPVPSNKRRSSNFDVKPSDEVAALQEHMAKSALPPAQPGLPGMPMAAMLQVASFGIAVESAQKKEEARKKEEAERKRKEQEAKEQEARKRKRRSRSRRRRDSRSRSRKRSRSRSGKRKALEDKESAATEQASGDDTPAWLKAAPPQLTKGSAAPQVPAKFVAPAKRDKSIPCKEVMIPQQAVSRLIGKGGEHITGICNSTGADVKIQQQTKDQGYSLCIITGPQQAMDLAERLVQQSLQLAMGR